MALPLSREETATPADPVRSNTINAIQDAIVGGKRGIRRDRFGPTSIASTDPVAAPVTYPSGYAVNTSGASSFICALSIPVGAIVTKVSAYVDPSGTNVLRASLRRYTIASAVDDILGIADSVGGTMQSLEIEPAGGAELTDGVVLSVTIARLSGAGSADRVHYVDVWYWVP